MEKKDIIVIVFAILAIVFLRIYRYMVSKKKKAESGEKAINKTDKNNTEEYEPYSKKN